MRNPIQPEQQAPIAKAEKKPEFRAAETSNPEATSSKINLTKSIQQAATRNKQKAKHNQNTQTSSNDLLGGPKTSSSWEPKFLTMQ
jgi:hypothetical protein